MKTRMYDRIKKSIYETTIIRRESVESSETQKYFSDLVKALNIEDIKLISVDTIEKKTYIIECNKQYYLVFDHYLMECMHLLNQIVLKDNSSNDIKAFFYKTVSEECYNRSRILPAIIFANKYLDIIKTVIENYLEDRFADSIPNYLFGQQAFLMAHEIFHFYIHKNSDNKTRGISSKRDFFQRIYNIVKEKDEMTSIVMKDLIDDKNVIEECLCDSTAIIQSIDVGRKLGKLNPVETGIAATIAVMNQYTLSIIRDAVNFMGDISYERKQNRSNFRLLHLKTFTSLCIKDMASEEDQKEYERQVEDIHGLWIEKVYRPIMHMLVDSNGILKNDLNNNITNSCEIKQTKDFLKEIYLY